MFHSSLLCHYVCSVALKTPAWRQFLWAHVDTLQADVLANTTSVGMAPANSETPVSAAALRGYSLVFDAVYTPLETRLLEVLCPASSVKAETTCLPNREPSDACAPVARNACSQS